MLRIEKQAAGLMTIEEMLKDLPQQCDIGAKKNAKGNLQWWIGYKLHITVDDHGIPIAGILTSASLSDNQVAIPLAKLTRVKFNHLFTNLRLYKYLQRGFAAFRKKLAKEIGLLFYFCKSL